MGKLEISKELSDKISKSLKIKQSDIIDGGANKPIVRNGEPPKKDFQPRQPSPRDSPIKKRYESPRPPAPRDYPIKNTPISYPKKSHRPNKANELNYLKISKIVFISSIVGGIGITLGLKIGTILFL